MKSKSDKSYKNQKTNSQNSNIPKGRFLHNKNWCLYLDEFATSGIFTAPPL